jgi:5-methylcytosine-specific restriction endonuclease McrA
MCAHFNPALVLNADYTPLSHFPLSIVSWQEAIRGVMGGKYDVVAEYEDIVHSPSVEMFVPSVVALRQYQAVGSRVAFTRFNVFLRDMFTCQYCHGKFASKDLTFEHVIPRRLGGQTTWENIVAACVPCNSQKGGLTDMKPLRAPVKPTIGELRGNAMKFPPNFLHETWRDYLYWDQELAP